MSIFQLRFWNYTIVLENSWFVRCDYNKKIEVMYKFSWMNNIWPLIFLVKLPNIRYSTSCAGRLFDDNSVRCVIFGRLHIHDDIFQWLREWLQNTLPMQNPKSTVNGSERIRQSKQNCRKLWGESTRWKRAKMAPAETKDSMNIHKFLIGANFPMGATRVQTRSNNIR